MFFRRQICQFLGCFVYAHEMYPQIQPSQNHQRLPAALGPVPAWRSLAPMVASSLDRPMKNQTPKMQILFVTKLRCCFFVGSLTGCKEPPLFSPSWSCYVFHIQYKVCSVVQGGSGENGRIGKPLQRWTCFLLVCAVSHAHQPQTLKLAS